MHQQPKLARVPMILHGLLFLIIAASVLTYWQSTDYALNGNWFIEYYKKSTYTNLVPTWQKAAKDGFALLLLLGSLAFRATNPHPALKHDRALASGYIVCGISLCIAFIRSLYTDLPNFAIFGSLRPIIFILAIFIFCHRHLQPYYLRWVLEATNLLAVIQVYYGIRQRSSAVLYNGVSWFDSGSARSVGTLTEPNSTGLFLALIFYINLAILPPHRLRPFLLVAIALGIFLTGSRAAQLSSLVILAVTFYRKYWRPKQSSFEYVFKNFISIPLVLLVGAWFYGQVNAYSGRAEVSSATGGRFDILASITDQLNLESLFLGKYLSYGSNIVQTLSSGADAANNSLIIADSTPAWIICQFGLLGVVGMLSVAYTIMRIPTPPAVTVKVNRFGQPIEQLTCDRIGLIVYLFFSVSTIIIFEFYAVLPLLITLLFPWQLPKHVR